MAYTLQITEGAAWNYLLVILEWLEWRTNNDGFQTAGPARIRRRDRRTGKSKSRMRWTTESCDYSVFCRTAKQWRSVIGSKIMSMEEACAGLGTIATEVFAGQTLQWRGQGPVRSPHTFSSATLSQNPDESLDCRNAKIGPSRPKFRPTSNECISGAVFVGGKTTRSWSSSFLCRQQLRRCQKMDHEFSRGWPGTAAIFQVPLKLMNANQQNRCAFALLDYFFLCQLK